MKIKVKNCSVVFEAAEYRTTALDMTNSIKGAYLNWADGALVTNALQSYSNLFPYKGGDIKLSHMENQWYGKAVICFYTDEGLTYKRFANQGTTSVNGLANYVVGSYADSDYNDYLIPENDILALGDIKYFRIGTIKNSRLGVSSVRYKVF